MNILFLFISWSFSALFFIFYTLSNSIGNRPFQSTESIDIPVLQGFTGSLVFESIFFFILGIILCIYFSTRKIVGRADDSEIESGQNINVSIRRIVSSFLRQYSYYLAFMLFYLSVFFILRGLGFYDLNYAILLFNVLLGGLFLFCKRGELIRDFIKINIILFSLYFSFLYLKYFIGGELYFSFLSGINNFITWLLFLVYIFFDSKVLNKKELDTVLFLHFCFYSFISICFTVFYFPHFQSEQTLQVFIVLGFIFHIILFFLKHTFFHKYRYVMRGLSLFFLYFITVFSFAFLFRAPIEMGLFDYMAGFILVYSIVFNYRVHILFENYISLIFSLLTSSIFIYFMIIVVYSLGAVALLIAFLGYSFFLLMLTYSFKSSYLLDYYILHIWGYVFSLIGIIYYCFQVDLNFINVGTILIFSSLYIFLSYFKLKNLRG